MANATSKDNFTKSGKVTEVCKQWTVREDGALAYRLQSEEISDHLQGNRFRNAVVRQDFPKALDEQIREQQLAEQAAAVYHQMLAEQEEVDVLYAKQLADKLKLEEQLQHQSREMHDERTAHHIAARDYAALPSYPPENLPYKPINLSTTSTIEGYPLYRPEPHSYANSPRRQALAMPLPGNNAITESVLLGTNNVSDNYLYTEPYQTNDLINHLEALEIVDDVGIPLEEISEREIQEQKDAFLALQLQQQEDNSEQSQLNRDRLLAMEAQDKELAKLLQERERQKAKRARERAKQKALAKKQQQLQQQGHDIHQIMPDDSYSVPADMLPSPTRNPSNNPQKFPHRQGNTCDEDFNYSSPVDILPQKVHDNNMKLQYSPNKKGYDEFSVINDDKINNCDILKSQAVRPTQLDLNLPMTSTKPRYPDPDLSDNQSKHTNIAMEIDPTYNRRSQCSVPYYDTSSSTVTTSTSSSSPGIALPLPDMTEFEEELSPAPPYMPIQGQRRTASLEKKLKKKSKDGCKQQ